MPTDRTPDLKPAVSRATEPKITCRSKIAKIVTAATVTSRRCLGAVRSLSPAAAIALALSVFMGGTGIAAAATGGNFILGKRNYETSNASLSSSRGSPLDLSSPPHAAPLLVNRSVLVPNLNAQYVSGLSASRLQATGGDGYTPLNTDTRLSVAAAVLVAATGSLPAGTYYVTATGLLAVATGDRVGYCYVAASTNPNALLALGGASQEGVIQAAETVAVSVKAGTALQEWCITEGDNGSVAMNAGITAIRILSSTGTPAAKPSAARQLSRRFLAHQTRFRD